MSVGRLLDDIRGLYLSELRETIRQTEADLGWRIVTEAEYLDADGEVVREGALHLPLCGDIFAIGPNGTVQSFRVDGSKMLSFEPIEFSWDERLTVRLAPFLWDQCVLELSPEVSLEDLSPVGDWFSRWFDAPGFENDQLQGRVHCLSDPKYSANGVTMEVDLGSAPVEAFEELLDAAAFVGARQVSIGIKSRS